MHIIKKLNKRQISIVRWLAGLISTDGCVYHQQKKTRSHGVVRVIIFSKEEDWLLQIKELLSEIGINGNISLIEGNERLLIGPASLIYYLVDKYAKEFMMDRKFQNLKKHYDALKRKYRMKDSKILNRIIVKEI